MRYMAVWEWCFQSKTAAVTCPRSFQATEQVQKLLGDQKATKVRKKAKHRGGNKALIKAIFSYQDWLQQDYVTYW